MNGTTVIMFVLVELSPGAFLGFESEGAQIVVVNSRMRNMAYGQPHPLSLCNFFQLT